MKKNKLSRRAFCGTVLGGAAAALIRPVGLNISTQAQGTAALSTGTGPLELGVPVVGIDTPTPRFSWLLEGAERGAKQSAYQVLVASSEAKLAADDGNRWDSGKVASNNTHLVAYDGVPLHSNQQCFWKIRAWDQHDAVSDWSEPAEFITGVLDPDTEWDAEWIGLDASPDTYPQGEDPFGTVDAQWITHPEGKDEKDTIYFRHAFFVDRSAVRRVMVGMNGHHLGAFSINNNEIYTAAQSAHGGQHYGGYLDISSWIQDGENMVAMMGRTYEANVDAKAICSIRIDFNNGDTEFIRSGDDWEATRDAVDLFDVEAASENNWVAARELGVPGSAGVPPLWYENTRRPPAVYLRHEFNLGKPVKKAVLHSSSFGLFDPHVNGARVTEDRFKPGWTDYRKRVSYLSYDVTAMLQEGENALACELADGWYRGNVAIFGRERYGNKTRYSALLHVTYEDDTTDVIRTDSSWKAHYGATLEADILFGEIHDARQEPEGWTVPGFDDSDWHAVSTGREQANTIIRAHLCEPVKPMEEITPVDINEVAPNVYVFDLGQNFSGWVRLKVRGQAGDRIVMRFAERLWPDTGRIYTENLRTLNVSDTYVLKGDGDEIWEPRFTYHGFRYVQVIGLSEAPTSETLTGVVAYSAGPVLSELETSSELINRIHGNITWGQRSNFFDIMTDCPQRDERMGWTGDYHIFSRTGTFNQLCGGLYRKWFHDVLDAQYERDDRADGGIPNVVPPIPGAIDAPGNMDWSYAMPVAASDLHEVYGDLATLDAAFPQLQRYMAYVQRVLANFDADEPQPGPGMGMFGDWVTSGPPIDRPVLAYAHAADAARLVAHIAESLGREDAAVEYRSLYDTLRERFIERWVQEDGTIANHAQTAYALAFRFGLVPEDRFEQAARRFTERIEEDDWRPRVGFLGIRHLLPAMTIMGRPDLAYKMLLQRDYPSWSFMMDNGATTIWERWNGFMPPDEFATWEMNSFNHYVFGAVDEWFFRSMLGIDWAEPGFTRLRLRPQIHNDLNYARGSCPTVRGQVHAGWEIANGNVAYNVQIPANLTADVYLPVTDANDLSDQGKDIAEAEGVRVVGVEDGWLHLEVESGKYTFVWPEST